ncbi:MAG: cadherin-like domain-containing protein, partial [Acidimicrobiia bacterium]|nr:cadherin-like domain-containing protein [Acidimicrobiia bacterium]
GTNSSGSSSIGNGGHGLYIHENAHDNLIGGVLAAEANVIAHNGGDGVWVADDAGVGNAIMGNAIHSNSGLGIDLHFSGVTANDAGDGDTGANNRLNFPVITSATESGGTVTVTFDLDVPANTDQYRVEFFTNPSGVDVSGYGEAETFVSAVTTPPGTGLTHTLSGSAGDAITATATRIDSGAGSGFSSTSEISAAYTVTVTGGVGVSFPVGYWTFDADATDSSGNGYHGSFQNGASVDTDAATNLVGAGKVSLDGFNDYVDLSSHVSNFQSLATGTITAWVYPDAASTDVIFESSDSGDSDSRVAVIRNSDGSLEFYVRDGFSTVLDVRTVAGLVPQSTWSHVAVSVDGTGNRLYVNGTQVTGGDLIYSTGSAATSGFFDDVSFLDFMAWGVHKYNNDGTVYANEWNGFIDDARIYDTALPAGEIADLAALPPVAVDDSTSTPQDTAVVVDVLANDTDVNGDTLSVDSVTQGSNGSVVNNGTDVTYTPNASYNGTDSFTYTVSDGNGGTDTATVTVSVSEPVVLDDIQKGTATLAGGSSSVTATIAAVDPTRAFLTFSVRGSDANPDNLWVRGTLTNATTVTFTRPGTTGTVTIEWSVVEFASGVTVQRGSQTLTGTTTDVPISAVDLGRSFPIVSMTATGTQFSQNDFARATLTSPTNLRLSIPEIVTNVVSWQVVTYNDSSVQSGSVAFAAGDVSRSATVTAVDPTKAWLLYTIDTAAGTTANIGQKMIRGMVTNGTTLTFDRSSTGQTMNVTWHLVEFTDATQVQHANVAFASSDTTNNVTITSVDPARSIGVGGYLQYGGRSAYTSDDNPGVGWFTTRLTTHTNLRVQRNAALATANLGWFVIHWPGTAAPLVVNSTGDAADNAPGDGYCWTGSNNTGGQRACTLRAAIQEANANPYADAIRFNMPATEAGHSAGVWTISPGSELPALSDVSSIDATTQPGWVSAPVVELNGVSAGASVGLKTTGDNTTIRGFSINRFASSGIEVNSGSSGVLIVGNYVGVDPTGTIDRGNGGRGVDLRPGSGPTIVGGASAADRNVVSGNSLEGILVSGSDGNTIIGNRIGTNSTGLAAIGNGSDGIHVDNGSDSNVIGQPGAGNVISGNPNDGIELDDTITGNIIQANVIGLGSDEATVVANGRHGVVLYNGVNNTSIGGIGAGNTISGNSEAGIHINGNSNAATTGNVIAGNLIGTDAAGTLDRGNGTYGVHVFGGAVGTAIGGTTVGAGNTISGNGSDGIFVAGAGTVGTLIHGNHIGVDVGGTAIVGNTGNGIEIDWEVPNQTIGGSALGAGNVISGNLNGIYSLWANDMAIAGNIIGLDAAGTIDLGNTNVGIRVGGDNVVIGGTTAGARNVVSGNGNAGIMLDSATSAVLQGNYIGTDVTGLLDRGNSANGVYVSGTGNQIGGSAAGAGNVISGNTNDGIQTSGSSPGTIIEGNTIGLGFDGSTPIPNSYRGISVYGTGARIGGTAAGAGNTIAANSSTGVSVITGATDVAVLGNVMVANGSIGIDLGNNGPTVNDAGDGDAGANDLLNFPVITSASESGGTVTVEFDLDVPAGNYRVEFFTNPSGADGSGYGEGETFVSSVVVTAGTGLSHSFSGTIGDVLTATATHDLGGGSYGDTSEFSAVITVVGVVPTAVDDSSTTAEDSAIVIDVVANDTDPNGDALSVQSIVQPASGTVVDNGDGTVTYTPAANWSGFDSFTSTV